MTKKTASPKKTAKKPAKTPKEVSSIKPLRTGTCKSLSGKSTLSYTVGVDSAKALSFMIFKNEGGGGYFASEFVSWKDIETAINDAEPVTSICLRPLFKGKSVNTSGFLLAVLVAEGILVALPKKARHFEVTGKVPVAAKPAKTSKRKASSKKS